MLPYSLPTELDFQTLKYMYPCKKTTSRRMPITGSGSYSGVNTVIQMLMPVMPNSFVNPESICLKYDISYTYTGTITGQTFALLGSAYSHFSNQTIKGLNGTPIETLAYPSLAHNALMNMNMDAAQRATLSTSWGTNDIGYYNIGAEIGDSTIAESGWQQSFCHPLISVLNTVKLLPMFVAGIQIDLALNDVANFIIKTNNAAAANTMSGFVISNIEIIYDVLTVEDSTMSAILQAHPQILKLKSQGYMYGSVPLASAAPAGIYQFPYQHSFKSLKQFIMWASPANSADLNFGGVNPNLQSFHLNIGSVNYPQASQNCLSPAECYSNNQIAFGALLSTSHTGCSMLSSFGRTSLRTSSTNLNKYLNYTASATATTSGGVYDNGQNPNKWYQCLDLEPIANFKDNMLSGISTQGGGNTLVLTLAGTLASSAHTVHYFSVFDAILEFDMIGGTITVVQ